MAKYSKEVKPADLASLPRINARLKPQLNLKNSNTLENLTISDLKNDNSLVKINI